MKAAQNCDRKPWGCNFSVTDPRNCIAKHDVFPASVQSAEFAMAKHAVVIPWQDVCWDTLSTLVPAITRKATMATEIIASLQSFCSASDEQTRRGKGRPTQSRHNPLHQASGCTRAFRNKRFSYFVLLKALCGSQHALNEIPYASAPAIGAPFPLQCSCWTDQALLLTCTVTSIISFQDTKVIKWKKSNECKHFQRLSSPGVGFNSILCFSLWLPQQKIFSSQIPYFLHLGPMGISHISMCMQHWWENEIKALFTRVVNGIEAPFHPKKLALARWIFVWVWPKRVFFCWTNCWYQSTEILSS